MALEERFYTCPQEAREILVWNRAHTEQALRTRTQPLILFEDGIRPEFASVQMSDGLLTYQVAAEESWWVEFDAMYPNQDAQTGDPYRRRYPRKDLPFVNFGG